MGNVSASFAFDHRNSKIINYLNSMPSARKMFAFGHLIFAWLVGKGYEYFSKKKIGHYTWFFLLFGSILPDMDYLLDWTIGTEIHRTFSHSLLFVIVAPLLVYSIFTFLKHTESKSFTVALAVGIVTHLIADMPLGYGVPILWPSLLHYSFSGVVFLDPSSPGFLSLPEDFLRYLLKLAILDMAIGTIWLFWLWFRKKLTF